MEKSNFTGIRLFITIAVTMVLISQCLLLGNPPAIFVQLSSLAGFFGSEGIIVAAGCVLGLSWQTVIQQKFKSSAIGDFVRPVLWLIAAYVLAWMVSLAVHLLSDKVSVADLLHLIFLQNFAWPMSSLFSESWLVPVVVFGFGCYAAATACFASMRFNFPDAKISMMTASVLIAYSLLIKFSFFAHATNTLPTWDKCIRTVALWRLDSFWIGTASGAAANYFKRRHKILAVLIGTAGILFFSFGIGFLHLTIDRVQSFWNVFYLPFVSFSLALLLPVLLTIKSRFPKSVSNLAFCAYLIYYSAMLLTVTLVTQPKFLIRIASYTATVALMAAIIWKISTIFGREWTIRKRLRKN